MPVEPSANGRSTMNTDCHLSRYQYTSGDGVELTDR